MPLTDVDRFVTSSGALRVKAEIIFHLCTVKDAQLKNSQPEKPSQRTVNSNNLLLDLFSLRNNSKKCGQFGR